MAFGARRVDPESALGEPAADGVEAVALVLGRVAEQLLRHVADGFGGFPVGLEVHGVEREGCLVVSQRHVGMHQRVRAVPAGDVLRGGLRRQRQGGEDEDRQTPQDTHRELQEATGP